MKIPQEKDYTADRTTIDSGKGCGLAVSECSIKRAWSTLTCSSACSDQRIDAPARNFASRMLQPFSSPLAPLIGKPKSFGWNTLCNPSLSRRTPLPGRTEPAVYLPLPLREFACEYPFGERPVKQPGDESDGRLSHSS